MTDWNKASRTDVEAAAARGDEDAKTALRIHQSLDRIEASVAGMEDSNQKFKQGMGEWIAKLESRCRRL